MSKGSKKPKDAEAIIIARKPNLPVRLGKAWADLEYWFATGYSTEEAAKAILDLIPAGAGRDYLMYFMIYDSLATAAEIESQIKKESRFRVYTGEGLWTFDFSPEDGLWGAYGSNGERPIWASSQLTPAEAMKMAEEWDQC